MKKYIANLNEEIQDLESSIASEQNPYIKIQNKYKLSQLIERRTYAEELIFNNFPETTLFELSQDCIPQETFQAAKNKAEERNQSLFARNQSSANREIETANNEIQQILNKDPQAENENNIDEPSYKRIKSLRQKIKLNEDLLINPKYRKANVIDYLKREEVKTLFDHLLDSIPLGNKAEETLLEMIKDFKPIAEDKNLRKSPIAQKLDIIFLNGKHTNVISKHIDFIEEMTGEAKKEVTDNLYSGIVVPIETEIEKKNKVVFYEAAKENGFGKLVDEKAGTFEESIYENDNLEKLEAKKNEIGKVNVNEATRKKIRYLVELMTTLGFVDGNASIKESSNKAYGFTKYMLARKELDDVVSAKEFDENLFEEKVNNLKKETDKIDQMFREIENELGSDFDTMPTNVDSYRNSIIPSHYKQNLVVNAKFNSLYIMASYIKENNLNIDEFLEDPTSFTEKTINETYRKEGLDNVLTGKTKLEAITYLSFTGEHMIGFDPYSYPRTYELLVSAENNPELKKNNAIFTAAFNAINGNVKRAIEIRNGYFRGSNTGPIKETLQNIFLAEDNISYLDCHTNGYESIDVKSGRKIKEKPTVTDKITSVEEFETKFYDMLGLLIGYNRQINDPSHQGSVPDLKNKEFLEAIQEMTVKFMLTHDLNEKVNGERIYSKEFVEVMNNLITDYKKIDSIKHINVSESESFKKDLNDLVKNKDSAMKKVEKDTINSQKTLDDTLINAFKNVNKRVDELEKRVDSISKKIGKGETNSEIEEIGKQERELFNSLIPLQNERLSQLRSDYENNKISKYYFNKRVEQIKTLEDLDKKPAMFACDEKSHKNFKTYVKEVLKLSEREKANQEKMEEYQREYNELMAESKCEKKAFYASKILSEKGIKEFKDRDAHNEITNDICLAENAIADREVASRELLEANAEMKRVQIVVDLEEPLLKNNEEIEFDNSKTVVKEV